MAVNLRKFSLILQIISSITTTVGILLIVWQVFIAKDALFISSTTFEAQTWQGVSAQMNDIVKIFIDHPELYPYFYENKKITHDDPNYPKAAIMAEIYLDFIDIFSDPPIRSLHGMGDDDKEWGAWKNYFHDLFNRSQILCDRFKDLENWYTKNSMVYKSAIEGCKN